MLLTYKNETTILYSGECRNTYFEIKRSGGNDEQNKQHKEKRGLSKKAGLASRNIVLNISRCVSLAVVFDFSSFL